MAFGFVADINVFKRIKYMIFHNTYTILHIYTNIMKLNLVKRAYIRNYDLENSFSVEITRLSRKAIHILSRYDQKERSIEEKL